MQRALQFESHRWSPLADDAVTCPRATWVDIQAATEDEFTLLEKGFGFHPLAVEDCRHLDQRSKVEEYDAHLFVVLHTYSMGPPPAAGAPPGPAPHARVVPHELHIFLTPTRVVTVHAEPLQALERVWQRALRGESSTCHGPGSILHALADEMVDQMYPVMDAIDAELEDLHGALLSPKPDPRILRRILVVKQAVREMRRLIGPVREVLGILHRSALPGVTDADRPYLRNVLDHLHVMQQQVEMGREHVADVRDLYMTAQAARTNEIVKRLTVVAVLGLPVTSITGFFGMNFEGLPFASAEVFHAALAGMVVIPVVMMAFLWWRRWV